MKAKSIAVFGVVVLVIMVLIGVRPPFLDKWLDNLNLFKSKPSIITFSDAIITDIQSISELTTTVYSIQDVIRKDEHQYAFGVDTGWWHMIMVVKGTVEAGLDLKQLDMSSVSVTDEGKNVTVELPQVKIITEVSQILISNKDDTYVYEIDQSVTYVGNPNKNGAIETELRGNAGVKILETACKDGILNDATEDARAAIEQFLKTVQPDDVNITVVSAPVPSVEECMKMGTGD